jgi:hypothetical protein
MAESMPVSNHLVTVGRRTTSLRELTYEQLQEAGSRMSVPDTVRPDLDLLITVGRFWGPDAVKRFRFLEVAEPNRPSTVESLIDRLLG